jgi:hypothetical protein
MYNKGIVTLDRQAAFNRAWEGLKEQGFKQARGSYPGGGVTGCRFFVPESGHRCAWGHVDPMGSQQVGSGGILSAQLSDKANLATYLGEDDIHWAGALQSCHDESETPHEMVRALMAFAVQHKLTIPGIEDPSQYMRVVDAIQESAVLDKDTTSRIALAVVVALAA